MEFDQVKLRWDFRIQTDQHLNHNRPDMVVLEKATRVCIVVACPFDTQIAEKEREKIHHYQDLKVEIQKMWICKSLSVVPVVTGELRAVTKNLMMLVTKIATPRRRRTLDTKGFRK